jgi:uncharacterized membrane protein
MPVLGAASKHNDGGHGGKEEGAGGEGSEGGHYVWIFDLKMLTALLIVIASALSLPFFRVMNEQLERTHPVMVALIAGAVVAVIAYPPMRVVDSKYALSNAALLGLLVAEFCIYGAPREFPAPVIISFFLFMYYMGRMEADHLWPERYQANWW